jgi:hypothetical protein
MAQAALPGSALANNIYFRPSYVLSHSVGFDAALMLHEVTHNLGALDGQLLTALGYSPDIASDNITQRLALDCFGVKQ